MGDDQIAPPPRWHMMLEGRVGAEVSMLMLQLPLLRMQVKHGQGPVMVLPGFMADDSSTWLLRRFLSSLGYSVSAWGMGLASRPYTRFGVGLGPQSWCDDAISSAADREARRNIGTDGRASKPRRLEPWWYAQPGDWATGLT